MAILETALVEKSGSVINSAKHLAKTRRKTGAFERILSIFFYNYLLCKIGNSVKQRNSILT